MITPRHQFCFTFHYVSILIVYRPGCFNASMTFTFHYVSILIRTTRGVPLLFPIYIPLYLYSNVLPGEIYSCELL